jgi:hypothetical protein
MLIEKSEEIIDHNQKLQRLESRLEEKVMNGKRAVPK